MACGAAEAASGGVSRGGAPAVGRLPLLGLTSKPLFVVCALLGCWAAPVRSAVQSWVEDRLRRSLGNSVADDAIVCESKVTDTFNCTINDLLSRIGVYGYNLRAAFEKDKRDKPVEFEDCTQVMSLLVSGTAKTRETCLAKAGQWPSDCVRMQNTFRALSTSKTWEIGVVCRIVLQPSATLPMPECTELARSAVAQYTTLTSCSVINRTTCVTNFCDVYGQFDWRSRPNNLFPVPKAGETPKFADSFVVPGCEAIDKYPFQPDECYLREDVHGFCDCLCEAMPMIRVVNARDCALEIDNYLMFGRLGIKGIGLSQDCEPELCRMFDTFKDKPECRFLDLPGATECEAMQLQKVEENCVWEQDSGEFGELECLDGYRCNLTDQGWACCESHLGRGRCPKELPTMCDTLCSGITEYCCEEQGKCTPRTCPSVLSPRILYHKITTTTTQTTEPPGNAGDSVGPGLDFGKEVTTPGSAIFVIFVVLFLCCFLGLPVLICACVLVAWQRLNAREDLYEPPTKLEQENDRHGGFWRVKPKPMDDDGERKRPVVELIVGDLPQQRPLGLELLETKVIRVHSLGAKWGFQVGDMIVEIGGVSVATFEDIWNRIQVERDRCPVRFVVERCGQRAVPDAEIEALEADRAEKETGRKPKKDQKKSTKVGPSPLEDIVGSEVIHLPRSPGRHWAGANDPYGTAGSGLPSALVGWETWATAPRIADWDYLDDDSRSFSASSPPRSPVRRAPKVSRTEVTQTKFMRAFPVTAAERLKGAMKSKKDSPGASDVRWVRDAWGRHVLAIGGEKVPPPAKKPAG
mmetsp:Transcript_24922/g.83111  ORF Transcript_24922/g.83111 Transcript_24922/m.83111 type:complete len:806 (+) Transcript_24922:47-2464(+)